MPVALGVNGGVLGSNNLPTATTFRGVFTPNEVARAIALGFWPINKSQAVTGVAGSGALGTLTVGSNADPYFNLTTLLLSTTATNGQQNNTFQDSSTNNFTITRNPATGPNAPTQGTFSPFSQTGWSNYFDGTDDRLSVPDDAKYYVGSSDFTIECLVYNTAWDVDDNLLFEKGRFAVGKEMRAYMDATSVVIALNVSGSATGAYTTITATTTNNLNTWYHLAFVRSGNTVYIFRDGTLLTSGSVTGTVFNSTEVMAIGGAADGNNNIMMNGYISNFRIITGQAVATSTFTPPTSPLTTSTTGWVVGGSAVALTGTVGLLTCQSNRFLDTSASPLSITVGAGTPTVAPFSPFNPTSAWSASTVGGSGYFDGTGDYLTTPDNAAFNLGSSDFLIEAWAYSQSSTNFKMIMGQWGTSNISYTLRQNAGKWVFTYTTNNSTEVAVNGTSTQILNAWTHLAVIRTGNTLGLFVNGTRETTASMTGVTIYNNTGVFSVGGGGNGSDLWVGYIGSSRLVLGTLPSGYDATQSTLTLPTAPFTSTASTSILLNFTNSGIYDATAKNVLETVGNAQVSTAISAKWGSTSMYFDGTGDYLAVPNSSLFDFGSSDWTIEFWLYRTATATQTLITKRTSNAVAGIPNIFANTSNKIVVECSGQTTLTPTGTISNNVWTHVAIVRYGSGSNNIKIYFGGTADATSVTWTTMATNTSPVYIGADTNGNGYTGYLQDIRISRYARYTANFTPPTAAFPVQ
jgi:Concanavalin A-like lectin/glucanases superfamily